MPVAEVSVKASEIIGSGASQRYTVFYVNTSVVILVNETHVTGLICLHTAVDQIGFVSFGLSGIDSVGL